jgi:hypothetical protein
MTTWLERCKSFILQLDLPSDADLKTCRRAFRENGWRIHGNTYWGRKKWGEATRGELVRRRLIAPPKSKMPDFGPDIIFPFRAEQEK